MGHNSSAEAEHDRQMKASRYLMGLLRSWSYVVLFEKHGMRRDSRKGAKAQRKGDPQRVGWVEPAG
jgi:hypothetical protein